MEWLGILGDNSKPTDLAGEGECGLLGDPESLDTSDTALLLWLGRGGGAQLVLKLSAGRYKIEYWGARGSSPMGVEIACAPTLVLSPPGDRPLVALVRKIPSH
jgi:hypothetical protein